MATAPAFPPFSVDDTDGETVAVAVALDASARRCVKLTCRAGTTFDQASGYLDPEAARALAAALVDAALAADLADLEDDRPLFHMNRHVLSGLVKAGDEAALAEWRAREYGRPPAAS